MALQDQPINHFVVLRDRGGNDVRLNFKSNGDSVLTAASLHADLIAAIGPLTQALILQSGWTYSQYEDDPTVDANNGEIEKRAELSVLLVRETVPQPGQTRYGSITIPAPVDALFQATSGPLFNVVDPTNAALQAFLALYTAGLGVLPAFTLSDYQTIEDPSVPGNVTGKRISKKSRKG